MKTTDTYLEFQDSEGEIIKVSIDSILEGGCPIDPESGDDLELVSDELHCHELAQLHKRINDLEVSMKLIAYAATNPTFSTESSRSLVEAVIGRKFK